MFQPLPLRRYLVWALGKRHPLPIYRAEHQHQRRRYTPRSVPGPAATSAAMPALGGVAEKSRHRPARFPVPVTVPVSLVAARSDATGRPGPGCLAFATCSTGRTRSGAAPSASGAFNGYSARLENDWLDLLTGRIGFAVQPNWLLYFQGGAAWRKNSLTVWDPTGLEVGSTSRTRTGWTLGVGSEYKFAPNWSVFVEYNHADFGDHQRHYSCWRRVQCKVRRRCGSFWSELAAGRLRLLSNSQTSS